MGVNEQGHQGKARTLKYSVLYGSEAVTLYKKAAHSPRVTRHTYDYSFLPAMVFKAVFVKTATIS